MTVPGRLALAVAATTTTLMAIFLAAVLLPASSAFAPRTVPVAVSSTSSTTSLYALNKRGKFNKQKDLAAKMAEAKRQRELDEGGGAATVAEEEKEMTSAEIKARNDKQRFSDLLENSMSGGGDLDKGYYLTEQQEDENADAVYRGVVRLYEGDPAPSSPFADLLNIENGEPIGKGGMKRLVPWERSSGSGDYLVAITDPRPKSVELRTAMKRLTGALGPEVLKKCIVINTDTPAENRRFLKKNLGGEDADLRIFCDEDMGWMREYTALGEKRFSITMFVLKKGRVEKLAREVEAEVLPMVVKNAISSLN